MEFYTSPLIIELITLGAMKNRKILWSNKTKQLQSFLPRGKFFWKLWNVWRRRLRKNTRNL